MGWMVVLKIDKILIMESIIIESCKNVYKQLGFGLPELIYEKALKLELQSKNINCENEYYSNLYYEINDEKYFLTALRIDIFIKNPKIVLELKTVKSILKEDDKEYFQVKRYQNMLNGENAYLINFGIKGLEIYNCNDNDNKFVNLV